MRPFLGRIILFRRVILSVSGARLAPSQPGKILRQRGLPQTNGIIMQY